MRSPDINANFSPPRQYNTVQSISTAAIKEVCHRAASKHRLKHADGKLLIEMAVAENISIPSSNMFKRTFDFDN